jgi:hypothetical protein
MGGIDMEGDWAWRWTTLTDIIQKIKGIESIKIKKLTLL